jgi:hypothetical protein
MKSVPGVAVGTFAEKVITAYKKVRPMHKPPLDVFFEAGAETVQGKTRAEWKKAKFDDVLDSLDNLIKVKVGGKTLTFDWPDTRVIELVNRK